MGAAVLGVESDIEAANIHGGNSSEAPGSDRVYFSPLIGSEPFPSAIG
jgi:hypothetical protein